MESSTAKGNYIMKDWNAEVKRDLTDIADNYYADRAPFWEVVIAVGEWVEQMERDGPTLFGSKQAYLDEKLNGLLAGVCHG